MAGELIKEVQYPNGGKFIVVVYDIIYEPVDCIVNEEGRSSHFYI